MSKRQQFLVYVKVGMCLSLKKAGGCVDLMMFNTISCRNVSIITSVTEDHQFIKCFEKQKIILVAFGL